MKKTILNKNVISIIREKFSKFNDGKKTGFGHTLFVLSVRSKKFILIKDGTEYETNTLKEMQEEFSGYQLMSKKMFTL